MTFWRRPKETVTAMQNGALMFYVVVSDSRWWGRDELLVTGKLRDFNMGDNALFGALFSRTVFDGVFKAKNGGLMGLKLRIKRITGDDVEVELIPKEKLWKWERETT